MGQQPSLFTQYEPRKTVRHLPVRETPAFRVANDPQGCSNVELLAAIIGGSSQIEAAQALVGKYQTLRAMLNAHPDELATVPGVGGTSAARIRAALSLSVRLGGEHPERPQISSPSDAAALVMHEMSSLEQEHLRVFLLDTRNNVIAIEEIYKGSVNSAQVRIGELFKAAVRRNATSIIITHNHPTGDPLPSPDDVALTRAVVQAGKLLDINCLDHLVIGSGGRWVSLKERGLGF